nr:hypothetical protein [Tanacetum cinerariifolium]
ASTEDYIISPFKDCIGALQA